MQRTLIPILAFNTGCMCKMVNFQPTIAFFGNQFFSACNASTFTVVTTFHLINMLDFTNLIKSV